MKSINLKKSAIALAVLVAVGSVGFSSAYGYGGGSSGTRTKVSVCHDGNTLVVAKSAVKAHVAHGDTEGACAAAPQVLGASTTQVTPFFTSIASILSSIQTSNQAGTLSNADAAKYTSQLSLVIQALMAMFK